MKTKSLLLFVIFVALLTSGCKKEKPAPVIPKEPINITAEDFALLAAITVDKQGLNESFSRFIVEAGYNINDVEADGARVRHFQKIWEYGKLEPIAIQYPLSVQLICEKGSLIEISNLEVFLKNYNSGDGLFQVNPRPKYIVTVGNKVFLVGYSLKLWRSRETIELETKVE